jgi:hypothetical protein
MNHRISFAALALLATAAIPAWAQADAPARVEVTAPRASVAERVLQQHRDEALYGMSSGRTMTLATNGDRLTMRYGRHLRRTLQADAEGSFVSSDGQVQLGFDLDAGGVRLVRLTLPADWQ